MKNLITQSLSIVLVWFISLILFTSCQKIEEVDLKPQLFTDTQYLVSAQLIADLSLDGVQSNLSADSLSALASDITGLNLAGIKVYKLVYKTKNTDGTEVLASGAFLFNTTPTAKPLLSYQHGTISKETGAPSFYTTNSLDSFIAGTYLATLGYVVSIPDYLGYGEDATTNHPYEHRATLASASLDMLRAAKEFSNNNAAINLNNQLFLTGYSEGGSATMALHQLIESSASNEFTVTASAPGAGAYDKVAFAKDVTMRNEVMLNIKNYSWVIVTYNKLYANLNRPLSYYFNEPYATNIANQPEGEGITVDIEPNPSKLFTQQFRDGLQNDTDTEFIAALNDNSSYDWKPTAPMTLFHGTTDQFVLFNAFNTMTTNGASSVVLFPITGTGHFDSVPAFVIEVNKFFNQFR